MTESLKKPKLIFNQIACKAHVKTVHAHPRHVTIYFRAKSHADSVWRTESVLPLTNWHIEKMQFSFVYEINVTENLNKDKVIYNDAAANMN